jgi:hypothetical protein
LLPAHPKTREIAAADEESSWVEKMPVDIKRDRRLGVSDPAADLQNVLARGDQRRHMAVAQIVEPAPAN